MINIKKITCSIIIGAIVICSPSIFGQKLYKWKDAAGRWHYSSEGPPVDDNGKQPAEIEVAEKAQTIIFKADKTDRQEVAQPSQLLLQKKQECEAKQKEIVVIAKNLQMVADKAFHEDSITQLEYDLQRQTILKLEEIGVDQHYAEMCAEDFAQNPKLMDATSCILEDKPDKNYYTCIKELPQE